MIHTPVVEQVRNRIRAPKYCTYPGAYAFKVTLVKGGYLFGLWCYAFDAHCAGVTIAAASNGFSSASCSAVSE